MSIRVGNFKVVYDSFTMQSIDPEYLSISRKDMEEYLKDNPMPDDPEYSVEEMIGDITGSSGFYTLPDAIKDKTASFVIALIAALM